MYQEIGGPIQNEATRKYIESMRNEGETVLATVLGLGEKTSIGAMFGAKAGAALGGDYLVVTDRRVAIIKSGVGTWATGAFGVKAKSIQYSHISSVDVSKGLMFGEIEVVAAGMVEKGSGGFLAGAVRDSVIQFEKKHFDEVNSLAGKIRARAADSRNTIQNQKSGHIDVVEQIRQLASLKEAGILSEEEFTSKKRELLARL